MKSSGRLFVLILGISIMVLAVCSTADVYATNGGSPKPPHSFHGSLTINGAPAPINTEVRGMVGVMDKTVGTHTTSVEGEYGNFPGFAVDCQDQETINFDVETSPDSGVFESADQSAVCERGDDTLLDLTVGFGICENGQQRLCPKQDGVCSGSMETCVGNEWPGCDDSTYLAHSADYEPQEASCDNMDNDCDGAVDGMTRDCSQTYTGICATGTETCTSGVWAGCPTPQTEVCNGLDDDCDGILDGSEGLFQQCGTGVGVCTGTETCTDQGGWEGCTAPSPSAELCTNGLDDDCDGFTDCNDDDCEQDPACLGYCIVITDMRLYDFEFNEVTEIVPETMYNVEVTNENTCEGSVTSMQIVQVLQKVGESQLPINLGTVKSTILPQSTSVVTVGFVLPDVEGGTQFTAKAFNWNHWISQDPGTFEILSNPASLEFSAAS